MVKQFLILLKMEFFSFLNKVRNNLATGVTVFLCSGVIFTLFVYIFHNFIETYLKDISLAAASLSRDYFGLLLILTGFFLGVRVVRRFLYEERTILSFAANLGEDPGVLCLYKVFYSPFLFLSRFLPLYLLTYYLFGRWFLLEKREIFLFLSFACVSWVFTVQKQKTEKKSSRGKPFKLKQGTAEKALCFWRLKRLLSKRAASRTLLFCGGMLIFLVGLCFYFSLHRIFPLGLAFLAGLLAGFALLVQVGEDFKSVWLERSAGVSHEAYMKAIFQLSSIIVFFSGFLLFFTSVFGFFFTQKAFDLSFFVLLVRLFLLMGVPVFLVNVVALQIDPRKVVIQSLVLFVLSFFLCTAFLVHLSFSLLVPFILSYGQKSQQGRFYIT